MKITFEINDEKIRNAVLEADGKQKEVKDAFKHIVQDEADFIADTMLQALLAIKADMSEKITADTPQTDMAEDIVKSCGFKAESYRQAKAKDEPQTDCGWK